MRRMVQRVVGPALAVQFGAVLPGLLLCFGIALVVVWARNMSGIAAVSPVVAALLLGLALGTLLGRPARLKPGIAFAVRPLLRAAIVLLGLQVTLGALVADGPGVLALAGAVVALTLTFTVWLGGILSVDRPLAQLIGTGTAICGASAIVAAN